MERPQIKDCFPKETTLKDILKVYQDSENLFNYAKQVDIYTDYLLKQRDELIKFVVDTMTAMPINSTIYKKADELLTKTQTK